MLRHRLSNRRTDTLDYLQAMLGQLRTMADADRYEMLAYLIEMAYLETGDIIRGTRPTKLAIERRTRAAGSV